ncbi:MAG: dihydroorotase [Spirochaetia bacterium]|nr:dihydroorotase [Spirochaetia bacterium]
MENSFTMRKPYDMHMHLRQGELLATTVRDQSKWFCGGLVMPNTIPPVSTPERLTDYAGQIRKLNPDFRTVMSFKLLPGMKSSVVRKLHDAGAAVGKLYPAGATTNSEDGVKTWHNIKIALATMCDLGMILSIHCERPDAYCLDREYKYHSEFRAIAKAFPDLKIVFEHISDRRSIDLVDGMGENIAGTITAHHLLLTLDDVIGGNMNPHNFCKPVVKTERDRAAIREAAFSGNKKFFFGSDSAPHLRIKKESGSAGGGIYSAPCAVPLMAELFEQYGCLDKLENFMSVFGPEFYGLPVSEDKITLVKAGFRIPDEIDGVVPLMAGKNVSWSYHKGILKTIMESELYLRNSSC